MRPGGDELRRLYVEEELSCSEIARRVGVVRQTVANWLAAEGIEQRPQKVLNPGAETVRRLYIDEKLSLREIAERYDTFIPVVSRWLKRAGVQSRSISEGTILSGKYGVHSEAHRETLRRNIALAREALTPEVRKRQGESQRGRIAPNRGKPMHENARLALKAYWADPENRRKASERMSGEKSPNWKGGSKPEDARRLDRSEWRRLRQVVYARDNWTCQDCGTKCLNTKDSRSKPKLKIQAHHKIPRRHGGTDDLENLVTLCMSCHHKRERAYEQGSVPATV